MQQMVKLLLRGGRSPNMMMKSISDFRMIPDGAAAQFILSGISSRSKGGDIEYNYHALRQERERFSSKQVAL